MQTEETISLIVLIIIGLLVIAIGFMIKMEIDYQRKARKHDEMFKIDSEAMDVLDDTYGIHFRN